MKSFKFLTNKEEDDLVFGGLMLTPTEVNFTNNEFCMQFDDDEPFVFATGNSELHMTIRPTIGGNITFNHNGRTFKLYARQRQND